MKDKYCNSGVRITYEVKKWFSEKAKENHRSFSGEIQHRLEKLMEQEQAQQENRQ